MVNNDYCPDRIKSLLKTFSFDLLPPPSFSESTVHREAEISLINTSLIHLNLYQIMQVSSKKISWRANN
jgi:hypothetical protein